MGGGALGRQMPRMDRDRYQHLASELVTRLRAWYQVVCLPRVFADKADFGDVDLLVDLPTQELDPVRDLGASSCVSVGRVLSFDYQGYQVDLIRVPSEKLELARLFSDFADLGGIVGSLCRAQGVTFRGTRGLYATTTEDGLGRWLKLSDDLEHILHFFGLDIEVWRKGFETQEQTFRWVATSRFCPARIELNSRERHRARPMMRAWLRFVNSDRGQGDGQGGGRDGTDPYAADAECAAAAHALGITALGLQGAVAFGQQRRVAALYQQREVRKAVKVKFNGGLVRDWTGLAGRQLGRFMAQLHAHFAPATLLDMSAPEIRAHVCAHFEALPPARGSAATPTPPTSPTSPTSSASDTSAAEET